MKLVFALLAHGNARLVERLVRLLVSEGHCVALHYDLKSPEPGYRRLSRAFAGNPAVRFARRVRVGWGQWSIVEATLNCLDEIATAGWEPDYVYYLSGTDYPIASSAELKAYLEDHRGTEFIESYPADRVRWVRTGPQQERYQYWFPFNWREQRRRAQWLLTLQKALGWKRRFVRGITPYIGSQWWVLTWPTLQKVMDLGRQRDIRRFFRSTLVPDELFFQTLVRHLVPAERIENRTLTLYQFSDYGVPVVYYLDHLQYLLRQPFFMARKISQHQSALRDALDEYWHGRKTAPRLPDPEIGKVSGEYENYRRSHRDGAPGFAPPGRPPRRRQGPLERLAAPYFAVLGSSAAELRLVHKALSRHPELLCHGQLFHPNRIEFADARDSFAGYRANAVQSRNVSAAGFLADIVRAEKARLSGFLLLWSQGGHIPDMMFERSSARLIVLRGDPLIAFSEEMLGRELLLDEPYDPARLAAIPPAMLALRYRRFLNDFRRYTRLIAKKTQQAANVKPPGWITEIDLAGRLSALTSAAREESARRRPGSPAEIALLRWRGRAARFEEWLGDDLALGLTTIAPQVLQEDGPLLSTIGEGELLHELGELEKRRNLVVRHLLAADPKEAALVAALRRGEEPQVVAAGN